MKPGESRARRDGPGEPRVLAIVPARLGSTRLARKMLLRESGAYLFEHTARNAARSRAIERVVIATDSEEILAAAREAGLEALPTAGSHQSGTDRVHEALAALEARGEGPWDVVINVQGDEPELPPQGLDLLVGAFRADSVQIATLCTPIASRAEIEDPGVVKVVIDRNGDALYFSRSPLPSLARCAPGARGPGVPDGGAPRWLRHAGVYAFRPAALRRFCALPPGTLERAESLEQLRWLEAGGRIRVLETAEIPVGIDTAEHYALFLARQRALGSPGGTRTR